MEIYQLQNGSGILRIKLKVLTGKYTYFSPIMEIEILFFQS
ncbi:protein of unknown function [Candidatus Nitrosocosmicus franklandus]|uniref:Uncharacterized protein n=1 Tax=Candidatus Nitrosocosmicus franklandianus TaxID=1798806 RepID=A0A484IBI6_9ARCH|nr:protein of unknown function [Candidatus Nitrosocosmicus franklandus]